MRVGSENRFQVIFLVLLAVIAALTLPRFFAGASSAKLPAAGATATAETKKTVREGDRRGKWPPNRVQTTASLDPSLRFDLLKISEDQQYSGSNRNPFDPDSRIEIPKPDPDFIKPKPGPVVVQKPEIPPIPLKFYGFATQSGQAKRIFLSSTTGDDIFVGSEGQVVARRYRIVKINNSSVEIEDILNNNKQTIPLTSQS